MLLRSVFAQTLRNPVECRFQQQDERSRLTRSELQPAEHAIVQVVPFVQAARAALLSTEGGSRDDTHTVRHAAAMAKVRRRGSMTRLADLG